MGLKNKVSIFDLVAGTDPVGDMDSQQGPQFQLPITDASQKHIDSLTEPSIYQHGNSPETLDPSNLDLNGNQGPSFDNGMSSKLHEDSLVKLYQYTYGNSTEETGPSNLDLDGAKAGNGIFDKGFKFRSMVLPDIFIDHASSDEQYKIAQLDSASIIDVVVKTLGNSELSGSASA